MPATATAIRMPKMEPVKSSNIAKVGYDGVARRLVIEFTNGTTYAYEAVDRDVHRAFLAAESKGKFFTQQVRYRYKFARVADPGERPPTPRFDPSQVGGAFDGVSVTSDADPGL